MRMPSITSYLSSADPMRIQLQTNKPTYTSILTDIHLHSNNLYSKEMAQNNI